MNTPDDNNDPSSLPKPTREEVLMGIREHKSSRTSVTVIFAVMLLMFMIVFMMNSKHREPPQSTPMDYSRMKYM
jgi:hypothetical protein